MVQLREYQTDALGAWDKFVDGGGTRGLMVLPTGAGKSVCVAQLPKKYGRTLVLAHREELLDQMAGHLQTANPGLTVAVEQAGRRAAGADLVVGSVPTLGRKGSTRINDIGDFKLVVVDEAHHASGESYGRVLTHYKDCLRLGVTATPQRGDGKRLSDVFDEVVFFLSILDLIQQGFLVPPVGYRVRTTSDLTDVHTRAGEFVERELADAVDTEERNKLCVDSYKQLASGRRAVVFAVNVAHAEHIEEAFKAAGIPATSVFGHTPKDERAQRLADFRAGKYLILSSVMVVSEGYDDPGISCLLMARPTRSPLLFTQQVGRGLRIHPGKEDCIIIDLADACQGKKPMGLPTLMGLPPDLDCQGKKLHEVADRFQQLEKLSPEEAARVRSAEEIEGAFEKIDLFRPPPMDPLLAKYTAFIWMETGQDHWVLNLAGEKRERLSIHADALGMYVVTLEREDATFTLGQTDDMVRAFAKTDAWVREYRGDKTKLLDRTAVWRQDAPTEKQLKWLKKYNIPVTKEMTKGEASLILDKLFAEKPKSPARRQRTF